MRQPKLRPLPTKPALELMAAGITGRELADELGVTASAVSFQLAGKSARTSPDLIAAIEARGGPELAGKVAELIDAEREART